KWTSLASIVSYSELLHSVGTIYDRTFQVIPLLIVAALWYLLLTTILSIGQHFVEKRFARGTRRNPRPTWTTTLMANLKARVSGA
ncbi:MAG: amino acid ABC transporter permease, partial [Dehalococcoidia bacterium]